MVTSVLCDLYLTQKHRDCHSLLCVTTVKSENTEIVTSAEYNLCTPRNTEIATKCSVLSVSNPNTEMAISATCHSCFI